MVRVVFVLDEFDSLSLRLAFVLLTALLDAFSAHSWVHRGLLLWFAPLYLFWMTLIVSFCGLLFCWLLLCWIRSVLVPAFIVVYCCGSPLVFVLEDFNSLNLRLAVVLVTALVDSFSAVLVFIVLYCFGLPLFICFR